MKKFINIRIFHHFFKIYSICRISYFYLTLFVHWNIKKRSERNNKIKIKINMNINVGKISDKIEHENKLED